MSKERKPICPKCKSVQTELNDEMCDWVEYYCDDCGNHFKDWGEGDIEYREAEIREQPQPNTDIEEELLKDDLYELASYDELRTTRIKRKILNQQSILLQIKEILEDEGRYKYPKNTLNVIKSILDGDTDEPKEKEES